MKSIGEHKREFLCGPAHATLQTGVQCICGKELQSSPTALVRVDEYGLKERFSWCIECGATVFLYFEPLPGAQK